jgi:hypothetical protein
MPSSNYNNNNNNNNSQIPECQLSGASPQSSLPHFARATILSTLLTPLPMPVWLPGDFQTTGSLSEVLEEALELSRQLEEHTAICMMMGETRANSIQTREQHYLRQ